MATVDPRAFDWGSRIMQGMERGRERRLQDIMLGQQQEDRAREQQERQMRMQNMRATQAQQQSENQYAQHQREAQTLFSASQALKRVPLERRRQTLETWAKANPIIGGAIQHIPPETDLSDESLDEFSAGMGAALQQYKSPQVSSDFLRALEIIKNPQATPQEKAAAEVSLGLKGRAGAEAITPYQQAQLDIERQKLTQKTELETGKAESAKGQKVRDAAAIARVKQMYSGIDAARGTLVNLAELEDAIDQGAKFGPAASKLPSMRSSSQRGDRALANLALSNIKQLPGPASDKDIAFIRQASISDQMDEKTMKSLIPQLKEAAARVIEKNMQVAALIEQGIGPADAERQVWQQGSAIQAAPEMNQSDEDLINKYLR